MPIPPASAIDGSDVGRQGSRSLLAFLPLAVAVTFLVVVAPVLLVVWLRAAGVVSYLWAEPAIAVAVSLLASYAGGAFWKTRADSRDVLFSDLMLWGWVQRWRSERRLTAAADLLGLTSGEPKTIAGGHLTNEQKGGLLTQLTSGLEARDAYTHGHSRRVARYASNIAKRMGLSRAEIQKVRAAGAMHDVGKVETPLAVLRKEGKLTDEEYAIIKRHSVDGAAMVSTLGDDELTAMVRQHHERLDGTGYPDGLAGQAISIGARILAVADTFDAVTSTRPYRHANPHKKALDILAADAGTRLDPDAVRAFCRCYSGTRPLACWTMLANARPRLASWLGAGSAPAQATGVGNVMAAAAAVSAIGGALVAPAADAGVLLSSSEPRSVPPALSMRAPEKSTPRPTYPRSPRQRGAAGSRIDRAGSSLDETGVEAQDSLLAGLGGPPLGGELTQTDLEPRDSSRAQNSGPPASVVSPAPRDDGQAPETSLDQGRGPEDDGSVGSKPRKEGKGNGPKPPKDGKGNGPKPPKDRPGSGPKPPKPPKGGTGNGPKPPKPPKGGTGNGPKAPKVGVGAAAQADTAG